MHEDHSGHNHSRRQSFTTKARAHHRLIDDGSDSPWVGEELEGLQGRSTSVTTAGPRAGQGAAPSASLPMPPGMMVEVEWNEANDV